MTYVWLGLGTALVAFGLCAVILPVLRRSLLDVPNWRSSHKDVTPRGGGIAVVGAIALMGTVSLLVADNIDTRPLLIGLGVIVFLALLGFTEDARGLPVVVRLGGQVAPGLVAGFLLVEHFDSSFWLIPILAFACLVVVNAANFMDGVNGISGIHGLLTGFFAVVAAWTLSVPGLGLLGVLVMAGFAGFLPWNIPRARMFLGDVGSYTLGACQWMVAAWAYLAGAPLVVAIAPVLPYLFDVFFTLVRRALRGAPLTEAHHEHLYQKVQSLRGTHLVSTASTALPTLACIIIGWITLNGHLNVVGATLGCVLVLTIYCFVGLHAGSKVTASTPSSANDPNEQKVTSP